MKIITRSLIVAAVAAATVACGSKSGQQQASDELILDTAIVAVDNNDVIIDDPVIELKAGQTIKPSDKIVVIDFNATWCPPCQKFGPIFHETAAEYADKYEFYSVDTDSCREMAEEFAIQSIPQVAMIYPDGRREKANPGYMSKEEFVTLLNSLEPAK